MLNWTTATEKPEALKRVLLRLSDGDIIRAMWVPKFANEDNGNFQGDTDYDEATGGFYWPEGWYEWNRNEEVHWAVSGAEPVEWMSLDELAQCQGVMAGDAGLPPLPAAHATISSVTKGGEDYEIGVFTDAQMAGYARAAIAAQGSGRVGNVQWWLARVDQYGNPTLADGAHSEQAGANQAMHLINALGLGDGSAYKVAKVELFDAVPDATGVNHGAVAELVRIKKGGAA